MYDVIDNKFIPSLFGCEITSNERDIIAMPVKEGGLGIRKISENSGPSFHASTRITTPLVNKIIQQSNDPTYKRRSDGSKSNYNSSNEGSGGV